VSVYDVGWYASGTNGNLGTVVNTAANTLVCNWPFNNNPGYYEPWPTWAAQSGSTAQYWNRWVGALARDGTSVMVQVTGAEIPTPERLTEMAEAQLAMNRHAQEEAARAAAAQAEADRKAEAALAALLDEEQRTHLAQRHCFVVRGSAGGRYRLYRSGGVRRVNDRDAETESLCIHADTLGAVPRADDLLAKLLSVQADEARFRSIANITALAA
jgi:hypothetical protein